MINQFHYPAWRALESGDQAIKVGAKMPEGLVIVPPGHQRIRLEIPVGLTGRIGGWISVLCTILSLALTWNKKPLSSSFDAPPIR